VLFPGQGPQRKTVTFTDLSYLPDQIVSDWVAVYVRSPASVESNHLPYTISCLPPPTVSIKASTIRSEYVGTCPPAARWAPAFQAVISVSHGPATVTYQWRTGSGPGSDPSVKTLAFAGDGPQRGSADLLAATRTPVGHPRASGLSPTAHPAIRDGRRNVRAIRRIAVTMPLQRRVNIEWSTPPRVTIYDHPFSATGDDRHRPLYDVSVG